MAADGRSPVHNRAGSNMTWGVATALLEQRGEEGLFEVDEAWLSKVAEQLDPSLVVLGNLFRDQLDRYGELETLAEGWAATVAARAGRARFVLNADDPTIADLGRDDSGAAREGVVYFGIEDASQALPELQHAFDATHCRRCGHAYVYERAFVGHLGHYSCPSCGAGRPAPAVAATAIELRGMEGSRVTLRTPAGELRLDLPLPGLYNVYNAVAAVAAALELGVPAERIGPALADMRAAFGRVETIEVGGQRLSILLIKNPAGANEVLRTLRLEAGEDGLDLWIALNDRIADGRDVSWVWDADFELLDGAVRRVVCAGTRAPEMALRLKYAGCRPSGSRSRRGSSGRWTGRWRGRAGACSRCLRIRRCWSCASCSLDAGSRRSSGSDRDPRCVCHLARPRVRRVHARPAGLGELAAESGGAILDLGCGTGRVALELGKAGHEVRALDRDSIFVAELDRRAKGLSVVGRVGDAAGFELGEQFGVIVAPMQLVQLLEGEGERGRCLRCVAEHLRPTGLFAAAIVDGVPVAAPGETWEPPLPDAREIEGWVYSSLPLESGIDGERIVVRRLRQIVSPAGELSEEVDETVLRALTADELENEARAAGLRPAGRREIPATDAHVGSTVVLLEKED